MQTGPTNDEVSVVFFLSTITVCARPRKILYTHSCICFICHHAVCNAPHLLPVSAPVSAPISLHLLTGPHLHHGARPHRPHGCLEGHAPVLRVKPLQRALQGDTQDIFSSSSTHGRDHLAQVRFFRVGACTEEANCTSSLLVTCSALMQRCMPQEAGWRQAPH